jgi:hypothetical protein
MGLTRRRVALAFLAWMPQPVREDVHAILIHAWQLVRTITSPAVRADISAILGHARRIVKAMIYRHPASVSAFAPVTAPAQSILATLQMVVHPRPGDVLWTAAPYSNFVPLRMIGEMRARSRLQVATTCVIRVPDPPFNLTSPGAELLTADALALLDASDLVLAVSERTRGELIALAARLGRKPPAVQVLQTGSGLRRLLDLDNDDSPKAKAAQAVMQPNLEIALPDPLWDEVAVAVKERLQMLLAQTNTG